MLALFIYRSLFVCWYHTTSLLRILDALKYLEFLLAPWVRFPEPCSSSREPSKDRSLSASPGFLAGNAINTLNYRSFLLVQNQRLIMLGHSKTLVTLCSFWTVNYFEPWIIVLWPGKTIRTRQEMSYAYIQRTVWLKSCHSSLHPTTAINSHFQNNTSILFFVF